MPRVESRRIGRVILYSSLTCGLGLAVMPPGFGARSATPPALDENHLRLGRQIVEKYLASQPEGAPKEALSELADLPPLGLKQVLEWLPAAPEQRPLILQDDGFNTKGALFAALLETSLTGINAAPLPELPRLFQQLPLAKKDPLRLHLLTVCARRAGAENQIAIALELLAAAARHPAAGWPQVMTLVEAAASVRQTGDAIEVLKDWLDDPPSIATDAMQRQARTALSRLLLLDHQPAAAWSLLAPLLNQEAPVPDATLELAWSVATAAEKTAKLVTPLEVWLRVFPQHRMHWRELADAPPTEAGYLVGLRRLARACQAAGNEARALEIHFHLAWLEHPRQLLPVLPAAVRLERQREMIDLLERLDDERPDPAGAQAYLLASFCLEQGEHESARWLLEARLQTYPQDLATTRLLLRARSAGLPPMQAALLWRRHLQNHANDSEAHHQLCDLWQRAGQTRAAVNHLLSLDAARQNPSLRLRLVEVAIESRHSSALVTALERLRVAGETLPPELTAPSAELLVASGHPQLATGLDRP